MSLTWKLVLSHFFVIAVGLLVLGMSTAFVAPETFSSHMQAMQMDGSMRGMMGSSMQAAAADLLDAFRQSLNNGLLIAGIAASLVGIVMSWYISRRIARPIRDIVKASQHISAGHYSERLLANQNDELGELMRGFNRMAESLAETENVRRRLLADVSHELKTPLSSIKGFMEGLQDGIIPPTAETFQLVHIEAERLQRLVNDLRELSQVEAAGALLDIRPCNMVEIVSQAASSLRPQFQDKGLTLDTDIPPGGPAILADPDRIRQVLINLIGNAIQYTPTGGRVTVRVRRENEGLHLSVHDTGIGLAKVDLDRIFLRFYRVDKSRARVSGGSGIGLTIARSIVDAHNGRIWAESSGLNQGSTFHIVLPAG